MQGDSLSVVAGACAADGDGDVVRVAEAECGDDFSSGDGLDDDVGVFTIEQRAKDGRVPVEVAGETLDELRLREDAGGVGEEFRQRGGEIVQSGLLLHRTACARVLVTGAG